MTKTRIVVSKTGEVDQIFETENPEVSAKIEAALGSIAGMMGLLISSKYCDMCTDPDCNNIHHECPECGSRICSCVKNNV